VADSISMSDPLGILLVIGVALLFLLIRLLPRWLAGNAGFISPYALQTLLTESTPQAKLLLLDVRMPNELMQSGMISGSLNIPLPDLPKQITTNTLLEVARDNSVIIICQTGTRAAFAARILQKAEFLQVSILLGGMSAWEEEGLPVTYPRAN